MYDIMKYIFIITSYFVNVLMQKFILLILWMKIYSSHFMNGHCRKWVIDDQRIDSLNWKLLPSI